MVELHEELDELTDRLERELETCRTSGCALARNEQAYRTALRLAILEERRKGTPATVTGDLCRGREDIAALRCQRDCSEAIYRASQEAINGASQEAINVLKLRIRMVDAQMTRIWNSGNVTQGGYL